MMTALGFGPIWPWVLAGVLGGPVLPATPTAICLAGIGGSGVEHSLPATRATRAPRADGEGYYDFDIVGTGSVPGTGPAHGIGSVSFRQSPFGIAVGPEGSYLLDIGIRFDALKSPRNGALTVWLSTPSLDEVRRVGVLDPSEPFAASVGWNKFLVIVTLEPSDDPEASVWSGPVVSRGMSRSGLMHTMAGHDPFEQENSGSYGYGGGSG